MIVTKKQINIFDSYRLKQFLHQLQSYLIEKKFLVPAKNETSILEIVTQFYEKCILYNFIYESHIYQFADIFFSIKNFDIQIDELKLNEFLYEKIEDPQFKLLKLKELLIF